jgi:aspartate 1-decarboxylase
MISLNGAAARKAAVGDRVIICAYGMFDESEIAPQAAPGLPRRRTTIARTGKDIPVS